MILKHFAAASVLTVAILGPHGELASVLAGVALVGVRTWLFSRRMGCEVDSEPKSVEKD